MAKTRPRYDVDQSTRLYLDSLGEAEPLSREREVELFDRAHAGDLEAEQTIIKANLRFVVSIALNYRVFWQSPLVELISEGNMGLYEAVRRFNNKSGNKFITYAVWWIRQAIFEALGQQGRAGRVPTSRIHDFHRLDKLIQEFIEDNNHLPSTNEMMELSGLNETRLANALALVEGACSLDADVYGDGQMSFLDILPSDEPDPQDEFIEKQDHDTVVELLDCLDNRERHIIEAFFGLGLDEPKTMEAIGQKMGLTRERVRQLRERALAKLRFAVRLRYIDGNIDEMAAQRFRERHEAFERRRDLEARREQQAMFVEGNRPAGEKIDIDFSDKPHTSRDY